ncbi:MAG: AraC family transcriptional regulator ligand-binding domain-containing protein [Alcanivoracaceae bacterium]|nr:AraC family transcriptional regulator ligand-binding domain-containing protein [Alcanivoracaceae bacterium]
MSDSAAEHYMTGLGLAQYVYGAERLGLPAKEILLASGLDPVLSVQPAQRIPQRQYESFLLQLALQSGDEQLGFHIGHQVMPAIYGALPALGFSAANGREALVMGLRYQALAAGNVEGFEASEKDDGILFTWTMVHQNPVMRRHVVDNVFALLAHMWRVISGGNSLGARIVTLEYPAPSADVRKAMEQLYGCPVRFSASSNQIDLGPLLLDAPLNIHDPEQLRVAEELARKQLAEQQQSQTWLAQVKRQVRDLMVVRSPRRETVAERLNISVRTLDRRLAEVDLTWQKLLDSLRAQLAREYLADPEMNVQAIATRLGFADVRAFQRRFRVWTGTTPSDYRSRLL